MAISRPTRRDLQGGVTLEVTSGASYAMNLESTLVIKKTSGSPTAVTLPFPHLGKVVIITDGKGDAASNNITISSGQVPSGGAQTINGSATLVLSNNYQACMLVWAGDEWKVVVNTATNSGSPTFGNVTLTGLLYESAADNLTATGSTQGTGLQLTAEVNRVTAGASTTGVVLPASAPGLSIIVINKVANSIHVYGLSSDKIDDQTASVGVVQMSNSVTLYYCTTAGNWYSEGLGTGYSGSLQTFSYADALSANSGGVQAGATPITTSIARFTTVGGNGYSSVLPTAAPGLNVTVINAGANNMNVFPAGSDQINTLAASAAFSLPPGGVCEFFTTVAGFWHTVYTNPTGTLPFSQYTSISSGNGTMSAGQIEGSQFCTLITSGATALTTRTAAQLLAQIPGGQVGMQWRVRIVNTNGGTLTITPDASITATGTLTLATNTWREWDFQITSATTATMKQIGTGTTS